MQGVEPRPAREKPVQNSPEMRVLLEQDTIATLERMGVTPRGNASKVRALFNDTVADVPPKLHPPVGF